MHHPDDDMWEEVARTIRPLSGKKKVATTAPPGKITLQKRAPVKPVEKVEAKPLPKNPLPAKQVKKLRSQKIPVEAVLDLHGMTLDRAHKTVHGFLTRARKNHLRCVEIVTGKGNPERGTGQLKRNLPIWLESEVGILHVTDNPQSRGGSFLIMLRRVRDTL